VGNSISAMMGTNTQANTGCALASGSLGSSSSWRVKLLCTFNPLLNVQYPTIGVCVSAGVTLNTSHVYGLGLWVNSSIPGLHVLDFAAGGSRNSSTNEVGAQTILMGSGTGRLHLGLLADGTNLHYQWSPDGYHWQDWYSAATPSSLDHYGFFLGNDFAGGGNAWASGMIHSNILTTVTQYSITAVTTGAAGTNKLTIGTHSLRVGDWVAIHGESGSTNVNTSSGNFFAGAVLVVGVTSTQISINTTVGGTHTSGGTVTLLTR
jgi:hypothetical protein